MKGTRLLSDGGSVTQELKLVSFLKSGGQLQSLLRKAKMSPMD